MMSLCCQMTVCLGLEMNYYSSSQFIACIIGSQGSIANVHKEAQLQAKLALDCDLYTG